MEQKLSSLEQRSLQAIDSSNPFNTPIRPQKILGQPTRKATPDPDPDPVKERADNGDDMIDIPYEDVAPPLVEEPPKKLRKRAALEDIQPVPTQASAPAPAASIEVPAIIQTHDQNGAPSYRCEFVGRDIFVGLPWRRDSHVTTTLALIAMALDFGKDRIRFDAVTNAEVHAARNQLVARFLETDAKFLFMLDHDMVPSIGRAQWFKAWVSGQTAPDAPFMRHVLHRLVGSGKTLVGGAYFGRQEGAPLICSDQTLATAARAHADRVAPVEWLGGGCLLIHRRVFEDIARANPKINGAFFMPNSNVSEDIAFCILAKSVGHQPHVDLGVPVKHIGYKAY
jgi:hypothetical protein